MCTSAPKMPEQTPPPIMPTPEAADVIARRDSRFRQKQAAMMGFQSTVLGSLQKPPASPGTGQTLGG